MAAMIDAGGRGSILQKCRLPEQVHEYSPHRACNANLTVCDACRRALYTRRASRLCEIALYECVVCACAQAAANGARCGRF